MADTKTPAKIAIVGGAGAVGATAAYALMISGLSGEIVLIDANQRRAEGEAMDLGHGSPFVRPVTVTQGSYEDCSGAQVVVITAGAAQKRGETRLDLVKRNVEIFGSIIPQVARAAPGSILLVVANPVDILTYATWKLSGFPAARVIGSGTVLDTARLRALLSRQLHVDPRGVHAYVIGEHGDSEVVLWSRASVAGMPISEFCRQRGASCEADMQRMISDQVRRAAYEIIERKGATYYAIGLGIRSIVESIVRDQNSILTVSTLTTGELGVSDICLSLPTIVNLRGAECVLTPAPNDEEMAAFQQSARLLHNTARAVGLQ
jgi:L-lactate dehydrogenase